MISKEEQTRLNKEYVYFNKYLILNTARDLAEKKPLFKITELKSKMKFQNNNIGCNGHIASILKEAGYVKVTKLINRQYESFWKKSN